ncbi:hypothetical protein FPOA_06553 [Fusarium poae]|uniref:Uncharacterized protein n=1 Tax=Fusarium poae TaxID=36050 RepID=A0A1B8AZZ7_FUSPO|nr:hypothetical protein FPOA_06553 [Fusarium poae]
MVPSPILRASLLGLPSELRNQIYQDYFTVDGGYVYDGDTDKLVQPGGKPIDISLRSTCRSIALETQDFPFSLNAIRFSTVYRNDWQKQAAYVETIFEHHNKLKKCLLIQLRDLVTSDMYEHSNTRISENMSIVEEWVATAKIAYSEGRHFDVSEWMDHLEIDESLRPKWGQSGLSFSMGLSIRHVLWIIAERHPQEFIAAIDAVKPGWSSSHSALDFFDLTVLPWSVPSLAELMTLAEEWQVSEQGDRLLEWFKKNEFHTLYRGPISKYRRRRYFSAASLAIRFLNQITKRQRLNIQNLIINEDRASGTRAESHPIGLIPFCIENPKLHIDHRINLWRNFTFRLGWPLGLRSSSFIALELESVLSEDEIVWNDFVQAHQVHQEFLQRGFVDWMVHVMDLAGYGMPLDSYTLTLDGDPDLNYSTEMFTSLMKHVFAELTMNSDIVAQGIFAPPEHPDYPFMTRQSMTEVCPVSKRSSILQCNFTLDQPWDYKKIVEENDVKPHPIIDQFFPPFATHGYYDVLTPSLSFLDIKLEYFDREWLWDSTDETMREYGDQEWVRISSV